MKNLINLKFSVFLVALFFICGCHKPEPIKIACVGNSITFGAGIENRNQFSYPAQLQKILGEGYIVKNFGNSGSTMLKKGNKPYWVQDEFEAAHKFMPNVVIIMLGTNDSKPVNWQYKDAFLTDYRALIKTFTDLPTNPKIVVMEPIPVIENHWEIQKEVVEGPVRNLVKQLAQEDNLPIIDLYNPMLGKDELLPDKIHPNADGAGLMAQVIAKFIKENKKQLTD